MTLKSSLKRGLAVAATVGLIGIGSALAAAPASAATQGDRLEGPLVMQEKGGASTFSVINGSVQNGAAALRATRGATLAAIQSAINSAPRYSIPAVGTSGPIMLNGLCLRAGGNDTARLVTCDDSAAQTYSWSNGALGAQVNPTTRLNVAFSTVGIWMQAGATYEYPVQTQLMTVLPAPIVAADVVITSPSADGSIGTHNGVVAGTAEPGSDVNITVNGVVVGTGTADGEGNFSVTLNAVLPEGDATLVVTVGEKSASITTTVTPSYEFAITSPADSGEVTSGDIEFAGTAAPGTEVVISGPEGDVTVTADDEGNWKATVTVADGEQSIVVTGGGKTIEMTVVGASGGTEGTPMIDGGVALGALVAAGALGLGITAKRRPLVAAA